MCAMISARAQTALPERYSVVRWVDFKIDKSWQAAPVSLEAKPKRQRVSKLAARPVVSACYPGDLPDVNKMNPIAAIVKWKYLINGPDGPRSSTTRHVLLTLSCHMDLNGGSCFPSHATLAKETLLSVRAIVTHMALAQNEQWFRRTAKPGHRSGWRRYDYQAMAPTFENRGEPDDIHGERGDRSW
jgi:hypothetical protein